MTLPASSPSVLASVADVATVGSTSLASERILPVIDPLGSLLPEGGLVRGRSWECRGDAATSVAVATVAAAARAGSWVAVVGVDALPELGVEAVAELGLPLERLVAVRVPSSPADWASAMGAVFDGFELVVTTMPRRMPDAVGRKLRSRIQASGTVMVNVADQRSSGGPSAPSGAWSADVVVSATTARWAGIGAGHGHLQSRHVRVELSGRRIPAPVTAQWWLPDPDGTIRTVEPGAGPSSTERFELAPDDTTSLARPVSGVRDDLAG